MADPKRHHWWPQLQSGYWCAADGCITVVGKDGVEFRTQPINVGLEKHLYSQVGADDQLNAEIERWLATEVDEGAVMRHSEDEARGHEIVITFTVDELLPVRWTRS